MKRVAHGPHVIHCIVLGLCMVGVGCRATAPSEGETITHMVNVGQEVKPRSILAGRGDEVRWNSTGTESIVVMFPPSTANRISCRTGFKIDDPVAMTAVIDPNASASLCFTQLGKYNYQVRMNQNLAGARGDQRASVWIVGRGEKNSADPYEEYTNFTP